MRLNWRPLGHITDAIEVLSHLFDTQEFLQISNVFFIVVFSLGLLLFDIRFHRLWRAKFNLGPDGSLGYKSMNLNAPARVAKFFLFKHSRFQVIYLITKAFISLLVLFYPIRF